MDIHVAVAQLPPSMQVMAERAGEDLYLVVAEGLNQCDTAVAVADVVCNAVADDDE